MTNGSVRPLVGYLCALTIAFAPAANAHAQTRKPAATRATAARPAAPKPAPQVSARTAPAPAAHLGAGRNPPPDVSTAEPAPPASAAGSTFTVNTTLDDELDGCAVNACTLREAVNAATNQAAVGGESAIVFDPTVFGSTQEITLTRGALTYAGSTNLTIVGPGSGLLTVNANLASSIFLRVFNPASVITISGMALRKGDGGSVGTGVIENKTGTLNLSDVVISDSQGFQAAAIYNHSGAVVNLSDCRIENNSMTAVPQGFSTAGRAVVLNFGTMSVDNSSVSQNSGDQPIIKNMGVLAITLSDVYGNRSYAIKNGESNARSASLTVTRSKIRGNTDESNNPGGAALFNQAVATISESYVHGNRTEAIANPNTASQGGGIYNDGGTLNVTSSTLAYNVVRTRGGAIYSSGGSLSLTNSTIFGNEVRRASGVYDDAQGGGGLYLLNAVAALTNCTIYRNASGADTGGVKKIGTATVEVYNTIIARNTAATVNYSGISANIPDAYGPFTTRGGNIVGAPSRTASASTPAGAGAAASATRRTSTSRSSASPTPSPTTAATRRRSGWNSPGSPSATADSSSRPASRRRRRTSAGSRAAGTATTRAPRSTPRPSRRRTRPTSRPPPTRASAARTT